MKRRGLLKSICRTAAVYTFDQLVGAQPLPVSFVNVREKRGYWRRRPLAMNARIAT